MPLCHLVPFQSISVDPSATVCLSVNNRSLDPVAADSCQFGPILYSLQTSRFIVRMTVNYTTIYDVWTLQGPRLVRRNEALSEATSPIWPEIDLFLPCLLISEGGAASLPPNIVATCLASPLSRKPGPKGCGTLRRSGFLDLGAGMNA